MSDLGKRLHVCGKLCTIPPLRKNNANNFSTPKLTIPMKNPLPLTALLLASSLLALGQDELKVELEETLFELTEQLEERKFTLQELEAELEGAEAEEDEFHLKMLEAEVDGIANSIERSTESLGRLRGIIDSKDLDAEQRESAFAWVLERHHRMVGLLELESESHRLEVELELHQQDDDEDAADRLETRLDRLNARIEKTKAIHSQWEEVAAARKAQQHEKAERLGQTLWIRERDLEVSVQLEHRKLEIEETRRNVDQLRREADMLGEILSVSREMHQRAQDRAAEWTKLKARMKEAQGEQKEELMEQYHLSEEKFHLHNEISSLRRELVFVSSEGDEGEAEELEAIIGDLELEIREIDQQLEK